MRKKRKIKTVEFIITFKKIDHWTRSVVEWENTIK